MVEFYANEIPYWLVSTPHHPSIVCLLTKEQKQEHHKCGYTSNLKIIVYKKRTNNCTNNPRLLKGQHKSTNNWYMDKTSDKRTNNRNMDKRSNERINNPRLGQHQNKSLYNWRQHKAMLNYVNLSKYVNLFNVVVVTRSMATLIVILITKIISPNAMMILEGVVQQTNQ